MQRQQHLPKMDRVKNKLAFCFAFQDDLEVASRTDREHRQHLRIIFQRLPEHGLVIHAEKCIFGVPSIDFLGHRVDSAGVTPLLQYVSAVVDFPQPSTVKELQAFLGMLNFYRRFCRPSPTSSGCSQTLCAAARRATTGWSGPQPCCKLSRHPRRR